jgi:hypothetical protein
MDLELLNLCLEVCNSCLHGGGLGGVGVLRLHLMLHGGGSGFVVLVVVVVRLVAGGLHLVCFFT